MALRWAACPPPGIAPVTEALLRFLAHACELEREAGERYRELAEAFAVHNRPEVADFFARMAVEAGQHLAEVERMAEGAPLPEILPWAFDWPATSAEAPETLSHEAVSYTLSLREAMALALQMERAAERFYRTRAQAAEDARLGEIALAFAQEEREHAAQLEQLLGALPEMESPARIDEDPPHMPE